MRNQPGEAMLDEYFDSQEQKRRVFEDFGRSTEWLGDIYADPNNRFRKVLGRRVVYAVNMVNRIRGEHGAALDAGCGSGEYAAKLMTMGFDTYGVDGSAAMVESCRRRFREAGEDGRNRFQIADVERLPFEDRSFDLVLSIGVFGYLRSDRRALAEVRRVLRPGGHFLLSVYNMMSLSNLDFVLREKLRRSFDRRRTPMSRDEERGIWMDSPWIHRNSPTHYRYKLYNPWKLERLMRGYGFRLVESMTFGQEFRILRKLRLFPERILVPLEIRLERLLGRSRFPYLRYSGEVYTGLFAKAEDRPFEIHQLAT